MLEGRAGQLVISDKAKKLIIDIQGGSEDVIALTLALKVASKKGLTVLGVTTVGGRRSVEQATKDSILACAYAGCSVPIYKGASESLLLNKRYEACINFNESCALLDREGALITAEQQSWVERDHASLFIARSMTEYKEKLAIISFGPLTNLALACAITDETITSEVHINGGQFTGIGNVVGHGMAEGNFLYDPEAAAIVLMRFPLVYINPIEKTLETSLRDIMEKIKSKSNLCDSIKQIANEMLSNKYCLCGPLLTILPVLDPYCLEEMYRVYGEVAVDAVESRGALVIDWMRKNVTEKDHPSKLRIHSVLNISQLEATLF